MNANAYGGQLGRVLEWVDVCTAAGAERRDPGAARLRLPAAPTSGPGEVVARACFRPRARRPGGDQGDAGGDARAGAARPSPPGSRPSARPSRTPRTRAAGDAPPGSCSRPPAAAACRSAAPASPTSTPTSSRTSATATTADVLELMAEGRRRVHERFGVVLEPEVQLLGEVRWPDGLGAVRRRLLLASRRSRRWSLAARLPVRYLRGTDGRAHGRGSRRDLGDRQRLRSGRGRPRRARSSPGCRRRRTDRCRSLPLAPSSRKQAPGRPGPAAGARPRRRAAGASALRRRAAITAKAGWTSMLRSGIELRFGDASQAAREVERGGGGPGRSLDYRARLCRPALAAAPGDRGSGHALPPAP